ncbi:hypothetical protein KC19_6G117900 [Ceratodon purpureus]|uniref:SnoaL-like domain-containing protein n=1 Tax=Ceratodon purpureus TaxID=3225 RepID=A0A8T0HEW4_CERPU|nr:hypothetical protein KC19_6G117900 [Ceratodon purpureus]
MATARGDFAAAASTSTSPTREAAERQKEAAELVQEFYAAINRREIVQIGDLFAEDCVYEDLVFPKPFVGRKAIIEFFQKFMNSVGSELEFKVDDITTGDPNAAGVIWHLEWKGKPFPFSKGCSFYRCDVFDGKRQIVYGRDAVEPATKPGDFTLVSSLETLFVVPRDSRLVAESPMEGHRLENLVLRFWGLGFSDFYHLAFNSAYWNRIYYR